MLHRKSQEIRRAALPPLAFKASRSGVLEGYASTFGNVDQGGDVVLKGAFARTLVEHEREGTMPVMLWSHDQARPIGRWMDMHEDDFGLYVRGKLNLQTTDGKNAYEHVEAGDVQGLSIGYGVFDGEYSGDAYLLKSIDLREVSAVAMPMNRRARIGGVKQLQSKSELVDLLREAGIAKSFAQRIAAGGWPANAGAEEIPHKSANDLAAIIDHATAQLRKI